MNINFLTGVEHNIVTCIRITKDFRNKQKVYSIKNIFFTAIDNQSTMLLIYFKSCITNLLHYTDCIILMYINFNKKI